MGDSRFSVDAAPTPWEPRPLSRQNDRSPAAPSAGYPPPPVHQNRPRVPVRQANGLPGTGRREVLALRQGGTVSRPRERVRGMNAALETGVAGVGEMAPARQPAQPRQMIVALLIVALGLAAGVLTYRSLASHPVSFGGEVVPQHVYALSFGTTGTVTAVKVLAGQHVSAGEVLAVQNASLAQADLQEAKDSEAAAAAALFADEHPQQSSVAREQDAVPSAKHRLAAAKAVVEQDEMTLMAKSIVAPASGTVAGVSAAAGDSITDAILHDPVVTIDSGPLMVFARLPGTEIGEVRPGQPVTFDIPQLGATLPGHVVQVDQSTSQSQTAVSYVVLCSIEPNHTALMAGMTVNITP